MNRIIGIALIAVSAASFGTLAIFGRFAYIQGIDTFTLLFLRFSFSAVLMAILLLLRRERLPRGRVLAGLIGMGAIGYVGQSFAYLTAIKYASSGLVALLLYLYPIFVALLSYIFLREKITPLKIIAMLVAFLGTALMVAPQGGQLTGILLSLAAAVIYSVYIIVGAHILKEVSAVQSSTVIFASAGIVYGMLTVFSGPKMPDNISGWAIVFGTVLIATVIPVTTFLAGLQRIGPTNAAMLSTLEPVVTVLLAALLLGETLIPITYLGGTMILGAVLLLTRAEFGKVFVKTQPEY